MAKAWSEYTEEELDALIAKMTKIKSQQRDTATCPVCGGVGTTQFTRPRRLCHLCKGVGRITAPKEEG